MIQDKILKQGKRFNSQQGMEKDNIDRELGGETVKKARRHYFDSQTPDIVPQVYTGQERHDETVPHNNVTFHDHKTFNSKVVTDNLIQEESLNVPAVNLSPNTQA